MNNMSIYVRSFHDNISCGEYVLSEFTSSSSGVF